MAPLETELPAAPLSYSSEDDLLVFRGRAPTGVDRSKRGGSKSTYLEGPAVTRGEIAVSPDVAVKAWLDSSLGSVAPAGGVPKRRKKVRFAERDDVLVLEPADERGVQVRKFVANSVAKRSARRQRLRESCARLPNLLACLRRRERVSDEEEDDGEDLFGSMNEVFGRSELRPGPPSDASFVLIDRFSSPHTSHRPSVPHIPIDSPGNEDAKRQVLSTVPAPLRPGYLDGSHKVRTCRRCGNCFACGRRSKSSHCVTCRVHLQFPSLPPSSSEALVRVPTSSEVDLRTHSSWEGRTGEPWSTPSFGAM